MAQWDDAMMEPGLKRARQEAQTGLLWKRRRAIVTAFIALAGLAAALAIADFFLSDSTDFAMVWPFAFFTFAAALTHRLASAYELIRRIDTASE